MFVPPNVKILILDLGSNSILAMVAKGEANAMDILWEGRVVTRLGDSLQDDGLLEENAVQRTLAAACELLAEGLTFCPDRVFCAATHALRQAANRAAFCKAFEEACDFPLHILSEAQEACYARNALADFQNYPMVFADIGGGSTEISFIPYDKQCLWSQSFPLGTLRARKMYDPQVPLLQQPCLERMASIFAPFAQFVATQQPHPPSLAFVFAGGCVTALGWHLSQTPTFDAAAIEALKLNAAMLEHLPVDTPPDATIGAAFILALTRLAPTPQTLRITTKGLRHGIAFNLLMHIDGV